MNFTIRPAREEDARGMVALLNPIIEHGAYTILDRPLSVDEQVDFVRNFPQGGVFCVAVCEDNGAIVGMQDVQPASSAHALQHVGEIATFVALDARRGGIGRALMRATLDAARDKGYRKIIAMIRADNLSAISFYESQGFERIGVAKQHAQVAGRYVDEILMERFID